MFHEDYYLWKCQTLFCENKKKKNISKCVNIFTQGPVVQSIVSLTSLLVIKILTALPSTKSNSQVFLLNRCEQLTFFSKNISVYTIFNDQSFNDMLTKEVISLNIFTQHAKF